MEVFDPELYHHLNALKSHPQDVMALGLDFSIIGPHHLTVDLVPNGQNIPVTCDNLVSYVYKVLPILEPF
jgi:hypothetical protein